MQSGEILHELVHLPPRDARLIDPSKERLPQALDDHGFVDINATIELVKTTVDRNFVWPRDLSVHHFQYPENLYPSQFYLGATRNPRTFRELPIHKGLVLRCFENWSHQVLEDPPLPDPDEMALRVESWSVAKNLFMAARKTVQWQRRQRRRRELILANPSIIPEGFNGVDIIGEEVMMEILESKFRGYEQLLEKQDKIPPEHRIIDISGEPEKVAKNLGKLANTRKLHLVDRIAS